MAKKQKQKPQKKSKKKHNPNRFQKQDDLGLFAFDPIRRHVLKWGLIAGAVGGSLVIQPSLLWQIAGIFVVVAIANYHISKAVLRIPQWHAVVLTYIGVFIAMVSMVAVGTLILTYFGLFFVSGGQ